MDSVTLLGKSWHKVEVLRTRVPHKQADDEFLLSPVGHRRLTVPYVYLLLFTYFFIPIKTKKELAYIHLLISINSSIFTFKYTYKRIHLVKKIVLRSKSVT